MDRGVLLLNVGKKDNYPWKHIRLECIVMGTIYLSPLDLKCG